MKRERLTHAILLAALLVLNAAVKYTLWIQTPQTFPDSVGYTAPAMSLLDGLGYGTQVNGFRPPTYPLFIAAILLPFDHKDLSSCRHARDPACLGEVQHAPGAQKNLQAIVFVQILLGMAIILMVYWFAWWVARNPWVAALCAATYAIDLSTAYWEISILSETLTTFLVTLVVCLTLLADSLTRHRRLAYLALGLALGATTFVRPNFFLFTLVPLVFLLARAIREHSLPSLARAGVEVAPIFLIPAFLVLAWSARNYFVDGYFTISTLTGYNLTQMTGGFMEKAPPQYRDLAEIYLEYRPERIEKRGSHTGTVFFAYRDMLAQRGITWAALSQELTQMSVQMILEHPGDYLKTVWEGFPLFWQFSLGRQNYQLPVSYPWVKWFWDSRLQLAFAILFFLTPLGLAWLHLQRVENPNLIWIWFALVAVWYVALVSTLFGFSDNARFRAPVARLQYSAIILTAWYIFKSAKHAKFAK